MVVMLVGQPPPDRAPMRSDSVMVEAVMGWQLQLRPTATVQIAAEGPAAPPIGCLRAGQAAQPATPC